VAAELEPSSTLPEENRLFRLAVDARNRGDDSTAVRYFGHLLSKYPKCALAQEAKVEQFRALKRLGRNRDAAREARRYLVEHSNGFAEEEARDVALTPGR
jgi:outer membrane protein assembly factor BamD (BamD/ComL family)